jgi:hypothetical protein
MVRDIKSGGSDSHGALGVASGAIQDLIRSPGRDEGCRILVVHVDVLTDGGFQLFDTSEDAPANALVSEFGRSTAHSLGQQPSHFCFLRHSKVNLT